LFQTFKLFNRFAQFKPSALFASRRYCFALSFRAEGEKSFPFSASMQDLSLPLEMTNCSHLRQRLVRGKNLYNGTVTI
jgi:hypothetical protein